MKCLDLFSGIIRKNIFARKKALTFHANCLLWRKIKKKKKKKKKNKKNINLSFVEFAYRVVKVATVVTLSIGTDGPLQTV